MNRFANGLACSTAFEGREDHDTGTTKKRDCLHFFAFPYYYISFNRSFNAVSAWVLVYNILLSLVCRHTYLVYMRRARGHYCKFFLIDGAIKRMNALSHRHMSQCIRPLKREWWVTTVFHTILRRSSFHWFVMCRHHCIVSGMCHYLL